MPRRRRTESRYERIVEDVYDFVEENLRKPGISFADFVESTPESERTIQRALEARGTSWHRVLTEARMDEAQFLLVHTDMSVSVVAVRCGYKTSTLLNDVFKRENGVTPGGYRQQQRQR